MVKPSSCADTSGELVGLGIPGRHALFGATGLRVGKLDYSERTANPRNGLPSRMRIVSRIVRRGESQVCPGQSAAVMVKAPTLRVAGKRLRN